MISDNSTATLLGHDEVTTSHPKVALVVITPQVASALLDTNVDNRRVRVQHVNRIAADIAAGEWQVTGDAIKFDTTGNLLDGQHRLMACVQAALPIQTFVATGLSPTAKRDIDAGAKRTLGDYLTWLGKPNASQTAAAIRGHYQLMVAPDPFIRIPGPTNAQSIDILNRNPSLVEGCRLTMRLHKLGFARGMVSATLHQLRMIDGDAVDQFVTEVQTGVGEAFRKGSGTYLLRQWAINATTNRVVRHPPESWSAITIKGWRLFVTGETSNNLRVRRAGTGTEKFPRIVDLDGNYWPIQDERPSP